MRVSRLSTLTPEKHPRFRYTNSWRGAAGCGRDGAFFRRFTRLAQHGGRLDHQRSLGPAPEAARTRHRHQEVACTRRDARACLDEAGRRELVDELQNLTGLLDRIILVTHQEEIARAFPNGYQIRLEDESSKVSLIE